MKLPAPPASLIRPDGGPNVGVFAGPIAVLNVHDFRHPSSGAALSARGVKRWQFLGIASPDVILGAAVVATGYLGTAFAYVFDRERRTLVEVSHLAPLNRGVCFGADGSQGTASWHRGGRSVSMETDRSQGVHRLDVDLPELQIHVELSDDAQPVSCCTRAGFAGFNYTVKQAGLAARGSVVAGGRKHELVPASAWGVLDFTTGRPQRETFWNWAAAAGPGPDGRILGLNLVLGLNESGVTENVIWIDGRPVKVDTVRFDYSRRDLASPWTLRSWDGRVDLMFVPQGERSESIDVGLLASHFHQPFGTFSGTLRDEQGHALAVDELPGFVEEHFARW